MKKLCLIWQPVRASVTVMLHTPALRLLVEAVVRVVTPLYQAKYCVAPPPARLVTAPVAVAAPLQLTLLAVEILPVNGIKEVNWTVVVKVELHPPLNTVTVYIPGASPLAVEPVCADGI